MAMIYESENFIIEALDKPHIDRDDGGHIMISPKIKIVDRQNLFSKQAIELMRLTIVSGQAMTTTMNKHSVDVGRMNYMDCGNWGVLKPEATFLHIHIYGRAKSAEVNKYGEAILFPNMDDNPEHYKDFKPLNSDDVREIGIEIRRLLNEDKFSDSEWGLSDSIAK